MTQPLTHYERTYLHLVPKVRRSFAEWQRARLVDIFVGNSVLKADLARLLRQCTAVKRCDHCRVLKAVTLTDAGWWFCNKCAESAKGATA